MLMNMRKSLALLTALLMALTFSPLRAQEAPKPAVSAPSPSAVAAAAAIE
jgi:hypothetical protein